MLFGELDHRSPFGGGACSSGKKGPQLGERLEPAASLQCDVLVSRLVFSDDDGGREGLPQKEFGIMFEGLPVCPQLLV